MTCTRSPDAQPSTPVTDLDHLTGDLVPHHPRRHDVLVAELGDLHVGAARRAVADPDLDVAGTRRRLGCVLDPDVSRRVEPRDLHGARHGAVASSSVGCSTCSTSSGSGCVAQCLRLVGVHQHLRELGEHLDVTVAGRRDADADGHLVAVPVDRLGEAQVAQRVAHDRLLAGQGAVRDGHAFADVRRDRALALEHRVDVRRLDRTHARPAPPRTRGQRASLLSARASRSIASRSSSSASERAPSSSAIDRAAVLHRVDDLRDGRVAEEHLERDDRLARRDPRARSARPSCTTTTSASSGI